MKKIAIFGAGGFGREVKWLIDDINEKKHTWDFIGYFDFIGFDTDFIGYLDFIGFDTDFIRNVTFMI